MKFSGAEALKREHQTRKSYSLARVRSSYRHINDTHLLFLSEWDGVQGLQDSGSC